MRSDSDGGVSAAPIALWARFTRLPRWGKVAAWLFLWPALVPLWILSPGATRGRSVAAGCAFLVLGFVWSAMCAGAISGDPPEERAQERTVAATSAPVEASADASGTPASEGTPASAESAPPGTADAQTAAAPVSTSAAASPAPSAHWTAAHVIDGDTIEVRDAAGTVETVRIIGIDTPERGECGFEDAADALARLVAGQPITLVAGAQDDRDRYGRLLRYLDVGPVDAGLELIRDGYAIARYDSRDGYGRHPREDTYVAADGTSASVCALPAAGTPSAGAAATTAPPPASSVAVFRNCADLNAVYTGGVARAGVTGNVVSGTLRPFGITPHFDDALYSANTARDRDDDGIACEK